VAEWLLNQV